MGVALTSAVANATPQPLVRYSSCPSGYYSSGSYCYLFLIKYNFNLVPRRGFDVHTSIHYKTIS